MKFELEIGDYIYMCTLLVWIILEAGTIINNNEEAEELEDEYDFRISLHYNA